MIARLWTGAVAAAHADEYLELMRGIALPDYRRVPGNAGIEANARQFVPNANEAWEPRFPGLFTIRDGAMNTGQLTGPGLGAVPPRT